MCNTHCVCLYLFRWLPVHNDEAICLQSTYVCVRFFSVCIFSTVFCGSMSNLLKKKKTETSLNTRLASLNSQQQRYPHTQSNKHKHRRTLYVPVYVNLLTEEKFISARCSRSSTKETTRIVQVEAQKMVTIGISM